MVKKQITWKELCEWCKSKGAKIKKPWFGFGMQSIEFPTNSYGVGIGIFQNGSWGAWFEDIDRYGRYEKYFVHYSLKPYWEIKEKIKGSVE